MAKSTNPGEEFSNGLMVAHFLTKAENLNFSFFDGGTYESIWPITIVRISMAVDGAGA